MTKSRHPRQKTASLDGNLSPIKHGNHLPLPQRLSVAFKKQKQLKTIKSRLTSAYRYQFVTATYHKN
ncbi:hypothetical protein [Marinomonas aquiplantarum]|uniref:hypothetical protein n=1 Tax=Marinomonas aquiplantarum TaxID=491951 RepID=UPI0011BDC055|nr:hypothetical protein [Marinomonas aquiplantarum]